jgi:hypothetical protein
MLRSSLFALGLVLATMLGNSGCQSCSSCHDYDCPVADCQCGHCPQCNGGGCGCGAHGGCTSGCCNSGGYVENGPVMQGETGEMVDSEVVQPSQRQ